MESAPASPASATSAQRACHALGLPRPTVAERALCPWRRRLFSEFLCGRHRRHGRRRGHRHRVRCRTVHRRRRHCDRRRCGRRRPCPSFLVGLVVAANMSFQIVDGASLSLAPHLPRAPPIARRLPRAPPVARRLPPARVGHRHGFACACPACALFCMWTCMGPPSLGPPTFGPRIARTARRSTARSHAGIPCRGSGIRAVLAVFRAVLAVLALKFGANTANTLILCGVLESISCIS